VRGLCGTFNGDQSDDFTTPEGDVELGVSAFANAFRAAGACPPLAPAIPDPCDAFPGSRERARAACAVLMGPVFQ
ncbi:SSPO protein, partial [Zosterops hypoxanthus]|nr:SSPO protein [Zosterops hypoxanthus]